jgi:hypothetical protein
MKMVKNEEVVATKMRCWQVVPLAVNKRTDNGKRTGSHA